MKIFSKDYSNVVEVADVESVINQIPAEGRLVIFFTRGRTFLILYT